LLHHPWQLKLARSHFAVLFCTAALSSQTQLACAVHLTLSTVPFYHAAASEIYRHDGHDDHDCRFHGNILACHPNTNIAPGSMPSRTSEINLPQR
jgi:hypothetical protein